MSFRIYLLIPKIKRERFEMFGFLLRVFNRGFGPIIKVILRDIIAFRFFAIFWSGTEVKIDGKELLIMKESDIMGIIEK